MKATNSSASTQSFVKMLLLICSIFLACIHAFSQQNDLVIYDIEGNAYRTVVIGKYKWMAENLKTTRFNDGKEINYISDDSTWVESTDGAFCWYNNTKSYSESYGLLYNWYAVNTRKLCPDGWRVPTDEEWKYLTGFVDLRYGINNSVWNERGLQGEDAGKRLKAQSGWSFGGNGSNIFGFTAIPGGERSCKDGHFHLAGKNGYWWSSTAKDSSDAWFRSIIYSFDNVNREIHGKRCGFAVRCLGDI